MNGIHLVKVENNLSECMQITTGISQGRIFEPLIFMFYINDVINNVADLRVNMYVDDCLMYSVGNNWERTRPTIQNGLNCFQQWCEHIPGSC